MSTKLPSRGPLKGGGRCKALAMDDWLKDPLVVREEGSFGYKKPRSLDETAYENWKIAHFSTRLKLEGADHFCRLALGAASMPHDCGLPLLARSQTKWYLDAFFFELMSAYDTLLQELNVVYDINRDIEEVRWSSIKGKLPDPLKNLMGSERNAEWFKRLCLYRNTATHHMYTATSSFKAGAREMPWHYYYYEVELFHVDTNARKAIFEDLKDACIGYLKEMTDHIHAVWTKMAEEFD